MPGENVDALLADGEIVEIFVGKIREALGGKYCVGVILMGRPGTNHGGLLAGELKPEDIVQFLTPPEGFLAVVTDHQKDRKGN